MERYMDSQVVVETIGIYTELDAFLLRHNSKRLLLVCDAAISCLHINSYFLNLKMRTNIEVISFSSFQPNPLYESVVEGVELFRAEKCDTIIAVGGGSAIDVAKCIKLFSNMDSSSNYLQQQIIANDVLFIAVPTTAGTGSEATKYAVIYFNGEKQSIADESCIPSMVLMDRSVLKTLPIYQKKATMLDALCHAIESLWSVNSTETSQVYAKEAIRLVFDNKDDYLQNDDIGNSGMLKAAYLAGKAINITQTTAGHAMCYKLTSMYNIAHGHAAALCVAKLWLYMMANIEKCIDKRGKKHLEDSFQKIALAMGYDNNDCAVYSYQQLLKELGLDVPSVHNEGEFQILKESVNSVRLKNNPVELTKEAIDELYHQILAK